MSVARIVPRSFGDMLPDPYDLVRSPAVRAVTAAAQENGCTNADYDTVYKHMRTHRFTKPASYSYADQHRMPRDSNPRTMR